MIPQNNKIQEKNKINKVAVDLYERIASEKIPGLHHGYYEKGIRSYEEAILNMNKFVGKLLDLDNIATINGTVLDAGCGTGGTSLYFAELYPTISFIGITLASKEVDLALKSQNEKKIKNTKFLVINFNNTDFSSKFFDGIFALDSIIYAEDKKKVLEELHRILKSNKKLVIISEFLIKKNLNYFIRSAYDFNYKRSAQPPLEYIENFKQFLEEVGFHEIKIQDITKNISISSFLMTFFSIIYFFNKKKYLKSNRNNISINSFYYLLMIIFTQILVTLSHTSCHMAITVIKK